MTYSSWYQSSPQQQGLNAVRERKLRVYEPGLAWERMEEHWLLPEALNAGTLYMLSQGERWLPKEPAEDDAAYAVRLQNSYVPPYLKRLEAMLAGIITRAPITFEDTSDRIQEHMTDVDLCGNTLDGFVGRAARIAISYGHVGTLVDMPADDESTITRPYWILYTPRQILGFQSGIIDGGRKIGQLRLAETIVAGVETPDNTEAFDEEQVEQVRVLTPGQFQLWENRPSAGGQWEAGEVMTTGVSEVTFAAAYGLFVGFLESRPPMEDVAYMNLAAYRRTSDLTNQLHIAAVPDKNYFGIPPDSPEEQPVGPQYAKAWPVDARIEFTEPQGTSYQYQFQHLEMLDKQIRELGLATIQGQMNVAESGLSKSITRNQGDGSLVGVALSLQDMIDSCLRFHAEYLDAPDEAGRAVIDTDFVQEQIEAAYARELRESAISNMITQETYLQSMATRGAFYEGFSVEQELEATRQQQAGAVQSAQSRVQEALNRAANGNGNGAIVPEAVG